MRILKIWREFVITRLTDSGKETGFFPNLSVAAKYFRKNPVSGIVRDFEKPGFLPKLSVVTKYFRKNAVSGPPC